ncbi:cell division protein FtsL [Sporosalibacterium faouarense]|uniref:cell division protein FtsL n=1 Tax=Sporosalibacterium faouarense TaxID=516123 RepID=UPI00141C93F7|nr:cell division protein FtsL [Sporosalibacterium faouarense]MTI49049.1 cell division protein FtsL [Bacillota bacterium]
MLVAKKEEIYYPRNHDTKRKNQRIQKNKSNRKSKSSVSFKLKLLLISIMMLVLCLSLLWRYTQIAQYRIEVSQLDQQISDLNKEKSSLEVQIDRIKESEWIEVEAREKLGMDYPKSSQTVFVSVDEGAFDKSTKDSAEEKTGFVFLKSFNGFFDKLSGLF